MSSLFSVFTSSSSRQQQSQSTTATGSTTSPTGSTPQRTTEARAAFDASLAATGASLDSELQARARNIHDNAARLTEQDRRVQRETASLKAEGDALEKLRAKTESSSALVGGEAADGFEAEIARIEAELGLLDGALDEVEGARGDDEGDGEGEEERDNNAADGRETEDSGRGGEGKEDRK